jgi:hypothetical protein
MTRTTSYFLFTFVVLYLCQEIRAFLITTKNYKLLLPAAASTSNALVPSFQLHQSTRTRTKRKDCEKDSYPALIKEEENVSSSIDPTGPSIDLLRLPFQKSMTYHREYHSLHHHADALLKKKKEGKTHHHVFRVKRLSKSPHIFLFQNLLSKNECDALIDSGGGNHDDGTDDEHDVLAVEDKTVMSQASITEGDDNMRSNCQVGWIPNTSNNEEHAQSLPLQLGRIVGNILMTNEAKMNGWCEPLQLVHYNANGGKFDLHYDGLYRSITVLYYLNGVGNTWFPFALTEVDTDELSTFPRPSKQDEAVQLVKDLEFLPGKHGILAAGKNAQIWKDTEYDKHRVVQVEKGDAIAFFNYKSIDGSDTKNNHGVEREWRSIHAGLPTTHDEGEKWIANHWLHHLSFQENWSEQESLESTVQFN